jgi:hypothetical protein
MAACRIPVDYREQAPPYALHLHCGAAKRASAVDEEANDEERCSRVGLAGVGSSRSANGRGIRAEWPAPAHRVLPNSADGRLTLAIDETFGATCTTYSAPSALESLDAAIENLRLREGMPNALEVGFVELSSGKQSDIALQRHPEAVATIAAWATSNGYDAAIWTALASNFDQPDKGAEPFSVTAAVRYLEGMEGQDAAKFARALAYIRNAPPEIETPVRDEVAKRWPG